MSKLRTFRRNRCHIHNLETGAARLNKTGQQSPESVLNSVASNGIHLPLPETGVPPEPISSDVPLQEHNAAVVDDFFSLKPPHGSKRSRQAKKAAIHLVAKSHGSKPTATEVSPWAFEHRWPHVRDHAEGRNHGAHGE